MRRILLFIFLLVGLPALAVDRITISLTVTNGTTNGMTFVLNGSTRTFTNNVQASSVQVLTNSTAAGTKTNLYNQVALNPFSQVSILNQGATNIDFVGASGLAMSATVSGFWGFVTYSTQTVSSMTAVRVPVSGEPTAAVRTNIGSGLVAAIEAFSTNSLDQNSTAASELVGLGNAQIISGEKRVENIDSEWLGIINSANISGTLVRMTNGTWTNGILDTPTTTNLQQVIKNPSGDGLLGSRLGDGVIWRQYSTLDPVFAFAPSAFIFYTNAQVRGGLEIYSGAHAYGSGYGMTNLIVTSTTNLVLRGTNTIPLNADIGFTRYALATLANGANSINTGTNIFIQVSGPSSAFSINGMDAQPNRDGAFRIILNLTGQNMTIAHDSGTEPTAANRIYTMTGSDHATTANGCAMFLYSASASRWILINLQE